MRKLMITILALTIFTGCVSQKSFLDKKSTCFEYEEKLEREIEKIGANGSVELIKLFYSPKRDTAP